MYMGLMESVPSDVRKLILSFLNAREICAVAATCKILYETAKSSDLWKNVLERYMEEGDREGRLEVLFSNPQLSCKLIEKFGVVIPHPTRDEKKRFREDKSYDNRLLLETLLAMAKSNNEEFLNFKALKVKGTFESGPRGHHDKRHLKVTSKWFYLEYGMSFSVIVLPHVVFFQDYYHGNVGSNVPETEATLTIASANGKSRHRAFSGWPTPKIDRPFDDVDEIAKESNLSTDTFTEMVNVLLAFFPIKKFPDFEKTAKEILG